MTATEIESPSGLVYGGKPVPWVTRWTEEVDPGPVRWDHAEGRLLFAEGPERRDLGVLWMRERDGKQGEGTPQFAQVSSNRQLDCMIHGLCQICGQAVPTEQTPWVIPGQEARLVRPTGRPFLTSTPPVCPDCLPLALTACPNLKMFPPVILDVKHWRSWGVTGEIVESRTGHRRTEVPLGFIGLERVLARQLVVEVWDYRKKRSDDARR